VHGAAEQHVDEHVPGEVVHHGARAQESLLEHRVVVDIVEHGEPVARGRLGVGPVGPELGEDAGVVAQRDVVDRVGLPGGGVDGVPGAGVAAVEEVVVLEPVVRVGQPALAVAVGRDVDEVRPVGLRLEVVRPDDDHLVAPAEVLIAHVVDVVAVLDVLRGRARVVADGVGEPVARVRGEVLVAEREARDDAPLGAEELERAQRDRVAGLVDEELDGERLPAVDVDDVGVAREVGEERGVDRGVPEVAVVALLVGVVAGAERDDRVGDAVAERGGGVALERDDARGRSRACP
jgi:hypothetical protein